jgi:arachidonate 15-lipoxygenase
MTQSPFQSSQPSLPNDGNKVQRQQQLRNKQNNVQYDFDLIPSLPMFGNFRGFPNFKWLLEVAKTALKLQQNTAQVRERQNLSFSGLFESSARNEQIINDSNNDNDNTDIVNPLLPGIFSMLDNQRINSPGNSLREYEGIFVAIPLPEISQNFLDDEEFAWMRIAGSNPLVIEKLTTINPKFPVTEELYQSVIFGDSLANALSEGRLFVTDYAILANVKAGKTDNIQKYIYAPLALFALEANSRELKPIAIQCGQDPVTNPIITLNSGEWAWKIAKTIVQIADANHHELISHLGLTHLLIEPFAIATERQLAQNHPLGILLRAHFEGTFFINDQAGRTLIGKENQPVDEILAGTLKASQELSAQAIQNLVFDQNLLPDIFKNRGVDSDSKLLDYPYRDDALKIWNAIHEWVSDYLSIYYRNPIDDVKNDNELQMWVGELISFPGGRLKGIGQGGKINDLSYLVDITTQIIFTASAQHAAVNFSQPTLMSYTPAMPMAGYAPIPTDFNNVNQQDFLNLLPPIRQAQGQLALTYLLGSVHYTQLGNYPTQNGENGRLVLGTSNPAVTDSLQKFKKKLEEIEEEIVEKNTMPGNRRKPYEFLIPSKIPQSINI